MSESEILRRERSRSERSRGSEVLEIFGESDDEVAAEGGGLDAFGAASVAEAVDDVGAEEGDTEAVGGDEAGGWLGTDGEEGATSKRGVGGLRRGGRTGGRRRDSTLTMSVRRGLLHNAIL